jgi:hypothetical protein
MNLYGNKQNFCVMIPLFKHIYSLPGKPQNPAFTRYHRPFPTVPDRSRPFPPSPTSPTNQYVTLQPVMSLQTKQERFEKYQEIWTKLNPNVKDEVWYPTTAVNYPWSGQKVEFWKTLRGEIQTRFRAVVCDECSSESTMKPILDFSFMDYSAMLLELLDTYPEGLNDYIALQDDISEVSANMDDYPED